MTAYQIALLVIGGMFVALLVATCWSLCIVSSRLSRAEEAQAMLEQSWLEQSWQCYGACEAARDGDCE